MKINKIIFLLCMVLASLFSEIAAQGVISGPKNKTESTTKSQSYQTKVKNGKLSENNQKKKKITKNEKRSLPSGYVNGYEAVDLGLSVRWASCNVGANQPSDLGGHFTFGDLTQEKYTGNYMDYPNGNIIESANDIATYYMGEGWRMPSGKECIELANKCTSHETIVNGVKGRLVIGPNGNSIFLPFSGIAWSKNDIRNFSGKNTPWQSYESYYWAGEANDCYGEGLGNNTAYLSYCYACTYKYFGCSVRAVTD